MTCPPSQSSALLTKGSTKQPVNDSNVELRSLEVSLAASRLDWGKNQSRDGGETGSLLRWLKRRQDAADALSEADAG